MGGAHRNPAAAFASVRSAISEMLKELDGKNAKTLIAERRRKFLDMGGLGLAA